MRLFSVLALAVCLPLAGVVAGCVDEEPAAPATAKGAAIRTEMRAADLARIDRAFERLASLPHRETRRIEQLGEAGEPLAFYEQTLERASGIARVLSADSSGRFDYGAFGRFTDSGSADARLDSTSSPLRWMLAKGASGYEPAYLTERARDAYAYERLEQDGAAAFQATARIGEGDEQAVRLVRYGLAPDGQIQTLTLERENAATLFDERTRMDVQLADGAEPLPVRVVTESRVTAPFSETRRFRLTRRFAPLR